MSQDCYWYATLQDNLSCYPGWSTLVDGLKYFSALESKIFHTH